VLAVVSHSAISVTSCLNLPRYLLANLKPKLTIAIMRRWFIGEAVCGFGSTTRAG